MIKTFNRQPLQVNIPDDEDIKHYFFNHTNWKGVNEDKNVLSIDQETFADSKNVYIDSEGLLKSRPSLKENPEFDNIIDVWIYPNVKVYQCTNGVQYFLYFVNSKGYFISKYLEKDNNYYKDIKLVMCDSKIFVFSEYDLFYYDVTDGTINDAEDFIYVPVTGTMVNDNFEKNESENLLTTSYFTHYIYDMSISNDYSMLIGKTVNVLIDGKHYEVKFKKNSEKVIVNAFENLDNSNFADGRILGAYGNGIPLIEVSERGNMLISSYSYTLGANDIPTVRCTIKYVNGDYSKNLNSINGVIGTPKISRDGNYAFVFTAKDILVVSLLDTDAGSAKYSDWTGLLANIKNTNSSLKQSDDLGEDIITDIYDNSLLNKTFNTNSSFNQSIHTNGYFVNDSLFIFSYADFEDARDADRSVNTGYTRMCVVYYDGNTLTRKNIFRTRMHNSELTIPKPSIYNYNWYDSKGYKVQREKSAGNEWVKIFGSITSENRFEYTISDGRKHYITVFNIIIVLTIPYNNVTKQYDSSIEATIRYTVADDADMVAPGAIEAKTYEKTFRNDYGEYGLQRTEFVFNNDYIHVAVYANIVINPLSGITTTYGTGIVDTDAIQWFSVAVAAGNRSFSSAPSGNGIAVGNGFYYVQTADYVPSLYITKFGDTLCPVVNFLVTDTDNKYYISKITDLNNELPLYSNYWLRSNANYVFVPPILSAIQVQNYATEYKYKYIIGSPRGIYIQTAIVDMFTGKLIYLPSAIYYNAANRYKYAISSSGDVLTPTKLLIDGDTDNSINLLFSATPVACTPNNIYIVENNKLYTNSGMSIQEFDEFTQGKINYLLPDIEKVLSNYYFAKGNELYISSNVVKDDKTKWYFPKLNKQTFSKNITNLHPISTNEMGIFFEDEVWYATFDSEIQAYRYDKSKLQIGCKKNCDVLTTFDGKYILFVSDRGLAAMSYQNFIASTEQSVSYISDNIQSKYINFIHDENFSTNAVKLYKFDYWIIMYKLNSNIAFVFDTRNNSWWPVEVFRPVNKIVTSDNVPKLLIDSKMYSLDTSDDKYYDAELDNKIEWFFKSQKLHLNALNNYKHIVNMTIVSLHDSNNLLNSVYNINESDFKLQVNCYRKKLMGNIGNDDFISINYEVSPLRTFVQRLNYSKVNEFQYQLSSNPENTIDLPLSLNAITIKYKVGGQVR